MNNHRLGRFVAFVVTVVLVAVIVLAYQIQSRNAALHELRELTANTERILTDALEARNSPAAAEQRQRLAQAVADLEDIRLILCSAPPTGNAPQCQQKGNPQ